jgi:hypothetical protein
LARVVADFRMHCPGIVACASTAGPPEGAPDAFEQHD